MPGPNRSPGYGSRADSYSTHTVSAWNALFRVSQAASKPVNTNKESDTVSYTHADIYGRPRGLAGHPLDPARTQRTGRRSWSRSSTINLVLIIPHNSRPTVVYFTRRGAPQGGGGMAQPKFSLVTPKCNWPQHQ